MKVKELIEQLGQYDPEKEVVVDTSEPGDYEARGIEGIVISLSRYGNVVVIRGDVD